MINFSPRFTLTGMKGEFPAAALAGLPVSSTKARPAINQVSEDASDVEADGEPGAEFFEVPFNEQTDPTRYAPMMGQPPNAITKTGIEPLFPTSSVIIATTFLPVATVATTITQSNTYHVSHRENTVWHDSILVYAPLC